MKLKKTMCGILAAGLMLTSLAFPASAEVSFYDLESGHWAYGSVMELVADGTVKGYEDGGFHPDGTVTRAEFVKMIGKGETLRTEPYTDVDSSHWGYDYIMASGLKTEGDAFLPDTPIKRGEVLELIWSRNGSVTGVAAPGAIQKQWSEGNAAAWGYTYGIMIGDDGYNLRLNEPLTRAEAAALIIRGRNYGSAQQINFEDTVSEDLLKMILVQSGLFDGDVSDLSRKVTNGEVAMATLRLMNGEDDPFVLHYPKEASDCKYGIQWGYVAMNYLNTTDYSEEKVNSSAALSDAVAMLTMGAVGKHAGKDAVPFDSNGYAGVPMEGNLKFPLCIAKGTGITFRADGSLDAAKETTLKDTAMILLQLDGWYGLKVSYTDGVKYDEAIQKDLSKYPANWQEYPVILESVPASVYAAPSAREGFENDYDYAREYSTFQANPLARLAGVYSTKDYTLHLTYYPSLLKQNADNYLLMRAKLTIDGNVEGLTLKDIFGEQFTGEDVPAGDCYLEIVTATPMLTAVYPEQDLIITQAIQ